MGANSLERRGRANKYTPLAMLELLKCAPRQAKPSKRLPRTHLLVGPQRARGGLRRLWTAPECRACTHILQIFCSTVLAKLAIRARRHHPLRRALPAAVLMYLRCLLAQLRGPAWARCRALIGARMPLRFWIVY